VVDQAESGWPPLMDRHGGLIDVTGWVLPGYQRAR
jgi:hypothetical protein